MNLLPYENLILETRLDQAEIQARLAAVLEPKKTFRMTGYFADTDAKPYEGRITGHLFEINRIVQYQNSFRPNIDGEISKGYRGSKVTLKMRLHPIVFVVFIIWCIGFFTTFNGGGNPFGLGEAGYSIVPIGFLIIGYAIATAAFSYESNKSKKFFAELFEAEVV